MLASKKKSVLHKIRRMAKKKQTAEEQVLDENYEFIDDDEPEKPSDEIEIDMHMGHRNVNVYTEEGLEEEQEEDQIAPWEEGFMEGELDASYKEDEDEDDEDTGDKEARKKKKKEEY